MAGSQKGVLVIYTGGTIGSKPRDPDPDSPQVVVPWEELQAATPELLRLLQRGLRVDCKSIEPLDSCNIGPKEWQQIAGMIRDSYDEYEGFMVLHGTDTMVYTASALSFMLRELGKPVILTGAQRSAMVDVRNDATQNFITSVLLAAPSFSKIPVVPEVCIYFGGKLYRGNRTIKRDTAGYDAYESPNIPPLGEVGDKIVIHEDLIRPVPPPTRRFNVRTQLDMNVTTILVYPGLQNTDLARRQLEGIIATPSIRPDGLKAAIVLSYGSGNIPTLWPDFLKSFQEAREKGVVVANVSQCRRGGVELGIYETSALLLELGFCGGSDITLEAALCKLMSLLGDPDLTQEEVEEAYQRSIAGEQSFSTYVTKYPMKPGVLERDKSGVSLRVPGRPIEGGWTPNRVDRALLRFRGASVAHAKRGPVAFRVFMNLDKPEDASTDHPGFVGTFKKEPQETGIIVFDVTRVLVALTKPGDRASFTIFLDTDEASLSWREVEVAVVAREAAV
ncbi:Cytoplasmic L-asparaginase I (modular protein) [Candidatus Sulfopaludibacter sp. SbA4]|nr:Cytoplasmic L-asparaginase I (modular protein) [Candidatus Sulfopaludibacter sp. SbA4]